MTPGLHWFFVTFLTEPSPNSASANGIAQSLPSPPVSFVVGASQRVLLSNIPLGPPGTTARWIYGTTVGGSAYYLMMQLNDNTSTSALVNTTDVAAVKSNVYVPPGLVYVPATFDVTV